MSIAALNISLIGKIRKILREANKEIEEIMKDTTLENPIQSDVIVSTKANAYDMIIKEYKDFLKKKKAEMEKE